MLAWLAAHFEFSWEVIMSLILIESYSFLFEVFVNQSKIWYTFPTSKIKVLFTITVSKVILFWKIIFQNHSFTQNKPVLTNV